jgi:hypothetical protein
MTTESGPKTDGTSDVPPGEVPNTETGAGLGAGDRSTLEPAEDPESVPDPQ